MFFPCLTTRVTNEVIKAAEKEWQATYSDSSRYTFRILENAESDFDEASCQIPIALIEKEMCLSQYKCEISHLWKSATGTLVGVVSR